MARTQPTERRWVSVLFVDLVASTRLARTMECDEYFNLMGEVLTVLAGEVEGLGGRVLQFQGDAVLAAFGTEADRGDDVLSALRAARAALAAIEASGQRAGLALCGRAGVDTGLATTGWLGGEYTLFGSVVNRARRLCSAAAPGEVLASAAARLETWSSADYEPRPDRELRDYADEGAPFQLLGFAPEAEPPASPFVIRLEALPELEPVAG